MDTSGTRQSHSATEASVATASERMLTCLNPITGEELASVPCLGEAEVRALVDRCRGAQREWASVTSKQRSRALSRVRRALADRSEEVASLVRAETGKALGEALGGEVLICCEYLAYLARTAPRVVRPRRAGSGFFVNRRSWVEYQPYGVIGAITPWNYPLTISLGVVATAVAAGNGVVLKPSEQTQLVGRLIGELFAEATGSPDLVLVATGDGATGGALIKSGVDKIAFTGSVSTGQKVMTAAAESLTPLVLELGGKDAMIVCTDADVRRAARGAVWAAFYGCGEICQSVERVYVVDSVYDEFVQAAVAEARNVKTSDESEANIGSLIAAFQVDKVERHIRDARDRGARVMLGGRALDMPGHFFEPTVVVDVDHSMELMRDETFGPVLPIMRVADEEEAIHLANDSEYGLDASVWSRDREKARRIARRLQVGSVLINDHLINHGIADLPFGGVRASGFGRVYGVEGLREFVRPMAWVEDRFSMKREAHWFRRFGSGEGFARKLLILRHGRGVFPRLGAALKVLRNFLS